MQPWYAKQLESKVESTFPILGFWIRRRALNELLRAEFEPHIIETLARIRAQSQQKAVKKRYVDIDAVLNKVSSKAEINAVIRAWQLGRDPFLEDLITRNEWIASAPAESRVLSALLVGKDQSILRSGEAAVPPLIGALDDINADIASRAERLLPKLKNKKAVKAVLDRLLEEEHGKLEKLMVNAHYEPEEPHQKALFFFLTEQWDAYSDLDFDQRLLRSVFLTAEPKLRQRITDMLRRSGRVELMGILSAGDDTEKVVEMGPREADAVIEMLADNENMPKLWQLALEVPIAQSAKIMRFLREKNWRPENDEHQVYDGLLEHLDKIPDTFSEDLQSQLLNDLAHERISMPGRINDIGFAPDEPHLAIAAGSGKRAVVVWDYSKAERVGVVKDLNGNLSQVAYSSDGGLFCGTESGFHQCRLESGESVTLEERSEGVRAIASLYDDRMVVAWRDGTVQLWDTKELRKISENSFPFWARSICVNPQQDHVLLMHKSIAMVSLPDLQIVARGRGNENVKKCACFSPEGEAVVTGGFVGELLSFEKKNKSFGLVENALPKSREEKRKWWWDYNADECQGIGTIPGRNVIIVGWDTGTVQFIAWPSGQIVSKLEIPGERLTSLLISPDGAFMAVGDLDRAMTLWDLRGLQVLAFFGKPFAAATPIQLSIMDGLMETTEHPVLKEVLGYTTVVLREKFRYDIEIDAPMLAVGDFDIEIE